jgi:hypothetical protein
MVNGFPNVYPQLPTNTELNVVYTPSDNENPSLTIIAQTGPSTNTTPENAKAQFQKRLEDNYPVKLITNYSLLLMVSNLVSKKN